MSLDERINEVVGHCEWAKNTIEDKVTFNLPSQLAEISRERRAHGALVDACKLIKELKHTNTELKAKSDEKMKYCYDYLDLVELVRYYDINTYEKIFGHGGRHGHLKLMIDRKVTKLISEDLILVNTELQSKLDKAIKQRDLAISALRIYANDPVNWIAINALKELGVE